MSQKTYRSASGKQVELDKLIMRNETVVAVGNAKVNARGDELGPGGQIIKRATDDTIYRADTVVTQPSRKVESTPVEEVTASSTVTDKRPRVSRNTKIDEAGE